MKLDMKLCDCGAKPAVQDAWIYVDFPFKTMPGFQVRCSACSAQTSVRGTKNAAIRDWNKNAIFSNPLKTRAMKTVHLLEDKINREKLKKIWGIFS